MDSKELIELYNTSYDEFKSNFIKIIDNIDEIDKINKLIEETSKGIYRSKINNGNKGHLYCLINEMFKYYGDNVYKLGMTKNIKKRLTGYTTSFIEPCEIKLQSDLLPNYELAELILFKILEKYRIKQNREFFKCDILIIQNAFKQVENMFKGTDELIYVNSILNNIKIELIQITGKKNKHIDITCYLDILDNNISNTYDSKISYLKTSDTELSEDKLLYDIINNDNIFNGCTRSLLLYYKGEHIDNKDIIEYIKGSIFTEKDNRILKRTELLRWIEKKLNIKRFEINGIQLSDEERNDFIQELGKLTDLLSSFVDPNSRSFNKITKRTNAKLNKLTKIDRIQKFVADLYNMYDDIISYTIIRKNKMINRKQIMLTRYTNFELKKSTINYHRKFIDKIGSDKFVSFDNYEK